MSHFNTHLTMRLSGLAMLVALAACQSTVTTCNEFGPFEIEITSNCSGAGPGRVSLAGGQGTCVLTTSGTEILGLPSGGGLWTGDGETPTTIVVHLGKSPERSIA